MRLEQYAQLKGLFIESLPKITKQLVNSQSIAQKLTVKEIPGSRYEDIVNGQYIPNNLNLYETLFEPTEESIKEMDLISIRNKLYESCRQTEIKNDRDILQELRKVFPSVDINFDRIVEAMREIKKKGGHPDIAFDPMDRKRVQEEALKPENEEKRRKFREEFGFEFWA